MLSAYVIEYLANPQAQVAYEQRPRAFRPDGRVELTMRVNGLVDARNLAIRWGEHVEVISPLELREEVRRTLQAAFQRYATP